MLATVLLPDRFTAEERRRIFEYYDPLTTGDSSLSECIQAIAAVDVGKYRTAEEYLVDAVAVDIADTAGNLRDGVHVASAGGTWMALVQGFAGYRWHGTRFAPMLPTRGRRLRFPLRIRGSVLQVDIEPERVTYTVLSGGPVSASHHGEPFTVSSGVARVVLRRLPDERRRRARRRRARGVVERPDHRRLTCTGVRAGRVLLSGVLRGPRHRLFGARPTCGQEDSPSGLWRTLGKRVG